MSKLRPSASHVPQFDEIIVMGPSHSAMYCVSAIGPSHAGNVRLMGKGLFHTTVTKKPQNVRMRKIPTCTMTHVINFSLAGATASNVHSTATTSEHVPVSMSYDGFEASHKLDLAGAPDELFPFPPLALRKVLRELFEVLHRNEPNSSAERACQMFSLQIQGFCRAAHRKSPTKSIHGWAILL